MTTTTPPAALMHNLLPPQHIRPHHLVVLVVEDMAVPYITGASGWIEREPILPRLDVGDRCGQWRKAGDEAGDHAGVHLDGVLPAGLVRIRKGRPVLEVGTEVEVSPQCAAGVG